MHVIGEAEVGAHVVGAVVDGGADLVPRKRREAEAERRIVVVHRLDQPDGAFLAEVLDGSLRGLGGLEAVLGHLRSTLDGLLGAFGSLLGHPGSL